MIINKSNTALIIGNFDGCHIGHQCLITRAVELASAKGYAIAALSFSPNPRIFFGSLAPNEQLFTVHQKIRVLKEFGIDQVLIKNFDAGFANLSPFQFYCDFLKQICLNGIIVVGDDFRFGQHRKGDIQTLRDFARADGIQIESLLLAQNDLSIIKSSEIRKLIKISGDISTATQMLGYHYFLEGRIDRGLQNGRKIGYPTANLHNVEQIIPYIGIYAGFVFVHDSNNTHPSILTKIPKKSFPAVISIGNRPTVIEDGPVTIEAHILNAEIALDSLYGMNATFYFCNRIRSEFKFETIFELQSQIQKDIKIAMKFLNNISY